MSNHTVILTGVCGFIGSHLADALLARGIAVIGHDNLIRGTLDNVRQALSHPNFKLIELDLSDAKAVASFMSDKTLPPIDAIWHLAANSDIPAGIADSDVDLRHTYLTTHNCLKIARSLGVPRFMFASSSAVYGEHKKALHEDSAPLFPISNYGAMKLASEGAISAALETFLEQAHIFRFPNVVGGRATHGVIYDLIGKLKRTRSELEVLGDGTQEKPYLHVSDLIRAMLHTVDNCSDRLSYHNVGAPDGETTTVRYIAERVVERVSPGTPLRFTGGSRGWTGDVARFSYSTTKLLDLGWTPELSSNGAVDRAVHEIAAEMGT